MSEPPRAEPPRGPEDRPPLLGSWRNLYLAVLASLAAQLLFFWWFTRYFG